VLVQLGVAEQQLHRPQVLGPTVDQGRLGAAQRMRAIGGWIQPDHGDPPVSQAGVLASRQVRRVMDPTREQEGVWSQLRPGDPGGHGLPGPVGELELHRLLDLVLEAVTRCATAPPWVTSRTRRAARSQPRSLLSMARLNRARSRS
jgi:hypothetical protein